MKLMIVRYQALAEKADANAALIVEAISGLRGSQVEGIRYEVFRHSDGWFTHIFEAYDEDSAAAFGAVPAVRAFQQSVRDRCVIPPDVSSARSLGRYDRLGARR